MEMMPIVNGLEIDYKGQVSIEKLNAALPEIAEIQNQWDLRGHPSFAVLDSDGRVVVRFLGPQSEETLREAIELVVDP